MNEYGYVRVSTDEQNVQRQLDTMHSLGLDDAHIFIDHASGKDFDRPNYVHLLDTISKGDLLWLDSLDRLGRNYRLIVEEWRRITRDIGCDIAVVDNDMFDSRKFRALGDVGDLMEDMMLSLLAWVADNERKKNLTRQAEGIKVAKREGKYTGRKPIDIDLSMWIMRVQVGEVSVSQACKALGISRATWYRKVA